MRAWLGMLTIMVLCTGAIAARAQSGWENELALEIEIAQKCKVAFLSHVVERTVDGRQLVMAKAHCEDQRVFDAVRQEQAEPFRFSECEAAAATSC